MSAALRTAVSKENKGRAALVAFFTCGFPTLEEAVDIMLGLERGGADVIEVGVPFSDPIADGPTIQEASVIALTNGTTLSKCMYKVKEAREKGLKVPTILMGYYNPFLQYGEERAIREAAACGVNGFIIVDLPPCGPESIKFRTFCKSTGLSLVPLVAPTTSPERLVPICSDSDGFIYCVSVTGVTGGRTDVPTNLKDYMLRVRTATKAPVAIGFGISTREQFQEVGSLADGVVVGSAFIKTLKSPPEGLSPAQAVEKFAQYLVGDK